MCTNTKKGYKTNGMQRELIFRWSFVEISKIHTCTYMASLFLDGVYVHQPTRTSNFLYKFGLQQCLDFFLWSFLQLLAYTFAQAAWLGDPFALH